MENKLAIPGTVTPTSLTLTPGLDFDEWMKIGNTLYQIHDGILWWIGDWILIGEQNYGEKYTQALRETDYDVKTLRNIAYISNSYQPDQRHAELTWSHHYAVAALPDQSRDEWLLKAYEGKWSISKMKEEIQKNNIAIPEQNFKFFAGEEIALHGVKWRVEWWDEDRITLIKADMWGKDDANKDELKEDTASFTVEEAEKIITGQSVGAFSDTETINGS